MNISVNPSNVLAFLRIQAHRPIYISREEIMARQASLASMSIEALVKLKDSVAEVLTDRATQLRKQLMELNGAGKARNGRKRVGRKATPKYRDPKTGETWSGRGGTARWLAREIKAGKKREDFLIAKPGRKKRKAK